MKRKISVRQIALIVVSVIIATLIAHYDTLLPHRWHAYSAPDGKFSIEFPAAPAAKAFQADGENGASVTVNQVSADPDSHTSYSCVYFDNETVGKESSEDALTNARDGSLRKTQGTVISEKRITVNGFPGLEFEANTRGNSILDSRMVVVGSRIYMVAAVAAPASDKEEKTGNRFFDSFKILTPQGAQ